MTKLTAGQRALLLKAAARDDGAVVPPRGANKAGAARIATRLIAHKLLRECKAKAGQPAWRSDPSGKSVCLILTKAGRAAVGSVKGKQAVGVSSAPDALRRGKAALTSAGPRAGSKQALLVGMLSKEQGATLDDLISATGWLPHTTRAALTGLRKKGHTIERTPMAEGRGSTYRIVASDRAAA